MWVMRLLRRRLRPSQLQPSSDFIRTIKSPFYTVKDKRTGRYIVSDQIFKPRQGESLSGDLAQLIKGDGLSETVLQPSVPEGVGSLAIQLSELQKNGIEVDVTP